MNEVYYKLISAAEKYNKTTDLFKGIYDIESNEYFDCIVVAPSWVPERIFKNYDCEISLIKRRSYFSSYIVKYHDYKIAWLQCAAGAGNLIDTVLPLGKANSEKIVFVGTVGALIHELKLGEIVTPKYSYAYDGASLYTYEELNTENYGKKIYPNNPEFINQVKDFCIKNKIELKEKVVFCTDSIICEYFHLDKIKALGSELIEMETAAFYRCLELINKKGIALLCVSDNSAANISLVGRTDQEKEIFFEGRETNIPKVIFGICDL